MRGEIYKLLGLKCVYMSASFSEPLNIFGWLRAIRLPCNSSNVLQEPVASNVEEGRSRNRSMSIRVLELSVADTGENETLPTLIGEVG